MTRKTIGLYYCYWPRKWWDSATRAKGPLELYRRGLWYKANPRFESYMRDLFRERYADGTFIDVLDDEGWSERIPSANRIVLLYPDATGIGFSPLERKLRSLSDKHAEIRVLNGRRRDFLLDKRTRAELIVRRLMERTMILELSFTLIFITATPILLAIDWLRGRK